MKIIFFNTLLTLSLLTPIFFKAQLNIGEIKIKVVDKSTKQVLPGVLINFVGTNFNAFTDSLGVSHFKNINENTYIINCSLVGYQKTVITNVTIIAGKIIYREIELQEETQSLNEVEISTFKYENNPLTPVSAYSFNRDEIANNPGAQGDIFRAIGMLPGVSSSGGIYSAIAVRGQGVRDNVYLVDDIPLTEVGHLEGNSFFNDPNGGRFSIFAPRVIESAQFQAGGFGSEFGRRSASYLGLTIKEGNKESNVIDGQVDLLGITLNYDGKLPGSKKTGLFVSARYQDFTALVNLIGIKNIGLPRYGDAVIKLTSDLNSRNKLSIIAILAPESYVRSINDVKYDKNLDLLLLPTVNRNKIVLGINNRTLINNASYIKNIIYYTEYTSKVNAGKAFAAVDSTDILPVNSILSYELGIQKQTYSEKKIGFRSIYNNRLSKHAQLICGLEGDMLEIKNARRQTRIDTEYVYYANDPRLFFGNKYILTDPSKLNADFSNYNPNLSSYLNMSFQFARLNFNLGVRYDYTGFSQQHSIGPRLSGAFHLSKKLSLNFGGGRYFQDPVYSDIADQTKNILKQEQTDQAIVGLKYQFREDLKIVVETWYKNFSNLAVKPILGYIEQVNKGDGWGKGIDFNLSKRLTKNFHGQMSYSYMECKRNDNDGNGEYDFMYSQPHQFNLLISYDFKKYFSFATKFRYATGKPTDKYIVNNNVFNNNRFIRYSKEITGRNAERLPDFTSWDIRVNYKFKISKINFTSFVDVVNVLNTQIANGENFNYLSGKKFYDGIAIFPSGGLKFEF